MDVSTPLSQSNVYARCVAASRSAAWDLEEDVIRGRRFTAEQKYLPDGLSLLQDFASLSDGEKRFVSQIQGRTYANVFGLVERFINAKILEISHDHWLGNQDKLEALVRFSSEELKHQAMFRHVEAMIGEALPTGYRFVVEPDDVARAVLGKCTWAVLALTHDIELFTHLHYRKSIDPDRQLSGLFKDVFLYHWKDESRHVMLGELEWRNNDSTLSAEARDAAVDDLIALVGAVDGILRAQAQADAGYFAAHCGRPIGKAEATDIEHQFLKAYRWQYIHSGAQHPHFQKVLSELITDAQGRRIAAALDTLH